MQFWGDANKYGNVFFHHIVNLTADGNTHTYEIWDSSNCANNDYEVYIDYVQKGTSTVQTACKATVVNTGMELYSPYVNSNEHSGTFYNYVQIYLNSQGYWRNIIFDSNTSNTVPCGDYDNCAMDPCYQFANGVCFHYERVSGHEWKDSKPS